LHDRPRVLITDPSSDLVRALSDVLEEQGDLCTGATSALEALQLASSVAFDVVVVDIALPDMPIERFIEQLRRNDPSLAVVGTVLEGDEERIRRALDADVTFLLSKPVDPHELSLVVRRAIEGREVTWDRREMARRLAEASASVQHIQEQLVRYQRLATIGDLGAGSAHEIKNLLGIVGVAAHYLRGKLSEGNEKLATHLDTIEKQVRRCNEIVMGLMALSRGPRPAQASFDLREMVDDVAALMEFGLSRRGIRVRRQYAADLPNVLGSSNDVKHVFINLILNARDAMPEGGELRIVLMPASIPVRADGQAGGTAVSASVIDTGEGIPAEALGRVFERFFTTKADRGGTGLGLAICRDIVNAHNGIIQAQSTPGRGTTVQVLLPAAHAEGPEAGSAPAGH